MIRVLVTGAAGFSGRYMCRYLKALPEGAYVAGIDVQGDNADCDEFRTIDVSDAAAVAAAIPSINPDFVIHLAGTFGTQDNSDIYKVNVLSVTSILEAIRSCEHRAVVVAAGSAAEYGKIAADSLPVTEESPCKPVTPYGLSKYLATQVAQYYARMHGIDVMVVRPFQLVGHGVTNRLAPGAFAEQVKQAVAEHSGIVKVGNLESSRDLLDIHDAMEAIWLLCQKPQAGEIFNICSGRATRIGDLLDMIIEESGATVRVEIDPARLRGAADADCVYGSYQKLKEHCGWTPRTQLDQSVRLMLRG